MYPWIFSQFIKKRFTKKWKLILIFHHLLVSSYKLFRLEMNQDQAYTGGIGVCGEGYPIQFTRGYTPTPRSVQHFGKQKTFWGPLRFLQCCLTPKICFSGGWDPLPTFFLLLSISGSKIVFNLKSFWPRPSPKKIV